MLLESTNYWQYGKYGLELDVHASCIVHRAIAIFRHFYTDLQE